MKHHMKLNPEPFEKIKAGSKTIELRLWDEKRRKLKIGDIVIFTDLTSGEEMSKKVIDLHVSDSFNKLFTEDLTREMAGANPDADVDTEMREIYSQERVLKYGVVGIELG